MGTQLVGEVGGQVADQLNSLGIAGFGEKGVENSYNRIAMETAANALIAAVTGGNIGSAAAGTAAGGIAVSSTLGSVAQWAVTQTGGDRDAAIALTSAMENIIASAAGVLGGVIGGAGSANSAINALNGAGNASTIAAYNADNGHTAGAVDDALAVGVTSTKQTTGGFEGYGPAPGPDASIVDPSMAAKHSGYKAIASVDAEGRQQYVESSTGNIVTFDDAGNVQTAASSVSPPLSNNSLVTQATMGKTSTVDDWHELSASLREASNLASAALNGKGPINFGMGSFNREQTMAMGEAWVGPGYRITSRGYYESSDGLRQFRPPSAKPNSQFATSGTQANFEQRLIPKGAWGANGHIDVTP